MENFSNFENHWEAMLLLFTEEKGVFKEEVFHFDNEVKTMRYLYQPEVIRETCYQWFLRLETEESCADELSAKLRESGNKIFKENTKNCEAALLYTKAIYSAKSLEPAALAHANRASALMRIGYFKEAYDDCECAKILGYPKENYVKIIYRQTKCAAILKDQDKLIKCLSEFNALKKNFKINKEIADQFDEFQGLQNNCVQQSNKNQNEHKCMEKKQKLTYDKIRGRFVVADEYIQKDEEILTEKAFSFVPVYNDFKENQIDFRCHNCATSNIIPFPCYNCRRVAYCSIKCKNIQELVHSIECPGYKKNLWAMIGIAHLAFRTICMGFNDLIENFWINCERKSYTPEEFWFRIIELSNNSSFGYSSVLQLVTNLENMPSKDFLRLSLTASMLCTYLVKFSNFLHRLPTKCYKLMSNCFDWELIVSSLLLRHVGQMICNAHCIADTVQKQYIVENYLRSENILPIGKLHTLAMQQRTFAAIYPKISLYNHSCEPNIRNRFNNDILTVYAAKDIKIGEEISNCYGPNFRLLNRISRKESLSSQYGFDCTCKHCIDSEDSGFNQFHKYICQKCSATFFPKEDLFWWRSYPCSINLECPKCSTPYNCEWYGRFQANTDASNIINNRKKHLTEAIGIYRSLETKLCDHHELKQDMASSILRNFIDFVIYEDKDLSDIVVEVSIDLLNAIEYQTGIYSLEFVLASAYLLDIIAKEELNQGEKSKLPNYDLNKIKSSFGILPDKMRKIFENYWRIYIH